MILDTPILCWFRFNLNSFQLPLHYVSLILLHSVEAFIFPENMENMEFLKILDFDFFFSMKTWGTSLDTFFRDVNENLSFLC